MQFRTRRVNRIVSGQTPRKLVSGVIAAVLIVPMCESAGRANVDVAGIAANHDVLRIYPNDSRKRNAKLDGVVMYPYDHPDGVEGYAQIFRDVCFEVVNNIAGASNQPSEPQ